LSRRRAALLLAALLAAAPGRGQEDGDAPPAGVYAAADATARHLEAVVPGALVAHALPPATPGRDVLLLVAPEENPAGPRRLYRLRPAAARLEPLLYHLPAKADRLVVAGGELLLGEPGAIYRLHLDGVPRLERLAEGPGLEPVAGGAGPGLALAAAGRLLLIDGGGPRVLPLPFDAARRRHGLLLSTPPVTALHHAGGTLRFAAGPQAAGRRRLLTVLIDPRAQADAAERQAWSLLPQAERVHESRYLMLDRTPLLAVATSNAERMVILGRKRLRLFPLTADRTRAGRPPLLAAELKARLWQPVELSAFDADGDGDDDLVVVERAGLGDGKLHLGVFPGRGGGRVAAGSRDSTIDIIDGPASGWHYGADLDGDGEADLLLRQGGELRIHRGRMRRARKGVVEGRPALVVALLPAGGGAGAAPPWGHPELADVDGDGRDDVVLAAAGAGGRGRLRLIVLERPPPAPAGR